MPRFRKRAIVEERDPDPKLVENLLRVIKFPRCSVCDLGWFDDDDDEEEDNEGDVVIQSKTDEGYFVMKSKELVPLPHCSCTTTLLTHEYSNKDLNQLIDEVGKMHSYDKIHQVLVQKFCYPHYIKKYCNTAMCKQCLYTFVSSSRDVIEHNYMSDTQPNIKFSVGGKCPCCRRKFSVRSLSSLVDRVKLDKDDPFLLEWAECIKHTILFIRFAKRLKRWMSCNRDLQNDANESQAKDIFQRWICDTDEHLSDDCFSDIEQVNVTHSGSSKGQGFGIRIVAPAAGEIRQDLLNKDPKFRQECEDLEYIREMSSTAEGRRALGIESPPRNFEISKNQLEEDERLARKLESEFNEKGKKKSSLLQFLTKGWNRKGEVSKATKIKSVKRNVHKRKRENSDIKKYMRSTIDSSDSDESVSIQEMESNSPHDEKNTCSVLKGSEANKISSVPEKSTVETIVIFDSDDDSHNESTKDTLNVPNIADQSTSVEPIENAEQLPDRLDDNVKVTSKEYSMENASPSTISLQASSDDEMISSALQSVVERERKKSSGLQDCPHHDLNDSYSREKLNEKVESEKKFILNEKELQAMLAIGFNRQECLESLKIAEYDGELAVNLLLNKRLMAE